MKYDVPHGDAFEIHTLVLDLNGCLSVKGIIPVGVKEKLAELKDAGFRVILFTGDIRGTAGALCADLGIEYIIAGTSDLKEAEMLKLDFSKCAAIGNARIDIGMFKHAKVSVLTLQAEGIHVGALPYVDIIVPTIIDAFDLFLDEKSLVGTLKE